MYQLVSRAEAQAFGKKRFYTGRACCNGHNTERYTSTGGCIACLDWKWRSIKHQLHEDVLKLYIRVPGTMSDDKRAELAKWLQDTCVPAFLGVKSDA